MAVEAVDGGSDGYQEGGCAEAETSTEWGREWSVGSRVDKAGHFTTHLAISVFEGCAPDISRGQVKCDDPRVQQMREEVDHHRVMMGEHAKNAAENFFNGNFGTAGREVARGYISEINAVKTNGDANRLAHEINSGK